MRYICSRKKTIAIVIIILLMSISFIPYTHGKISVSQFVKIKERLDNNICSDFVIIDSFKEILVNRYNPDGSVERNIVKIPSDQFEKFVDEINGKNSLKDRFDTYKKYNLISMDASYEQFEKDIGYNENNLYLNQKIINKFYKFTSLFDEDDPIMSINSQCEVYGVINYGMKYFFGLSALTSFINFLFWHKFQHIPSADLLDIYAVDWGKLDAINGTMPDFHTDYDFLFIILAGFVGYTFAYPPVPGKILIGEFFGRAFLVMCQH